MIQLSAVDSYKTLAHILVATEEVTASIEEITAMSEELYRIAKEL